MKKLLKLSAFALAASALFVSCNKETAAPEVTPAEPRTFTLSLGESQPAPKVWIDTEDKVGKTSWYEGDKILFSTAAGDNQTVTLDKAAISEDGKTATVVVTLAGDLFAAYPADAIDATRTKGGVTAFTKSNVLKIAAYQDGASFNFALLDGVIDFNVASDVIDYDSFELKGNNDEVIAYAAFDAQVTSEGVVVPMEGSNGELKTVTGNIDALSTGQVFIPGGVTFEKGFTITLYSDEEAVKFAKTDKAVTVGRGQILALGDIVEQLKDVTPDVPTGFSAADFSGSNVWGWTVFDSGIDLSEGFTYIFHYRQNAAASGVVRFGNFADKDENWINMIRFNEARIGGTAFGVFAGPNGGRGTFNHPETAAEAAKWHQAALIWNATTKEYKIAIDTKVVATDVLNVTTPTFQAIEIGESWDGSSTFNGQICEVSVWNKPLTAKQLYAAYSGIENPAGEANLKAYWPMHEGTGVKFAEASGKFVDWDLSGMYSKNGKTCSPQNITWADGYEWEQIEEPADPTPVIEASDIENVAAEGVTSAQATYTLKDAEDWNLATTFDGTVVTAATAAEGTITYTVAPNETTEVRNGWIKLTLSKEGKDDIVKEIVVTQQANTPVQLVEGTVPNMNQKMFGVTFPDEFASLDATTFEGWVNAVNYTGAQANLPTFMGTENAFMVRFDGGKPEIVLGDPVTGGGEIKASSKTAMSTGEWHHIAAVYTRNAKVVLYVDGKKVAENNTKDYPVTYNSGVKPGTNDDAKIGRKFWVGNAFSTRWFNASMSHLRVWSKALTNDEIVASANNRALETAEGLIANWPLTEDKGLKVTDLSGNGLNAEYKSASDAAGVIETTEPERTTGVELPTLEAPVHPTSIKITAPATSVKATETLQLTATVLPENAWDKSVSWRSENEEIATVDANGLVKGVYPGTVKIYAENAAENLSDNVTITVEYLYEPGTVTPDFSVNYNSVAINWGSNDVSALNKLTVEWKMNAKAWTNSYQYRSWNGTRNGSSVVNSVFGVEGKWLLRIGDTGIPNNQLELADHSARLDFDFQTDTWYAVAVTYDVESGKTEFYVNGELKGSFEGTATKVATLTGAYISQSYKDNSVNSRYFNGYIADVRVWNTIRTAKEIKKGINEFADEASENLLLYLKLDEGLGKLVNSASASDATASFTAEAGWGVLRPEIEVTPDATSGTIEDLTPGDWSWN